MRWTREKVAELHDLLEVRHLTTSRAARIMRINKSCINGKTFRIRKAGYKTVKAFLADMPPDLHEDRTGNALAAVAAGHNTLLAIAKQLNLKYETTRAVVATLIEQGKITWHQPMQPNKHRNHRFAAYNVRGPKIYKVINENV